MNLMQTYFGYLYKDFVFLSVGVCVLIQCIRITGGFYEQNLQTCLEQSKKHLGGGF